MGRRMIAEALGLKGNRQGEVAVDNRLRELKRLGCIVHDRPNYRVDPDAGPPP